MIRWNGKRYVPAGVKPLMKRKGVNVPGMPKTKWIASWVGGESVPECDFTFDFILDPTPTPTQTLTSTATPTPTITSSSTPTPTPTETLTPTPTPSQAGFDPDAAAYLADVIASGGTTDTTISAATNTLFTELKSNGLYDKMILFYPFVGGSSGSHALMGNRTSGTTYDLTFVGGITHTSSGATGNGTNGGANTNYSAINLPQDRFMGLYGYGEGTFSEYMCGGGDGNENAIITDFSNNNTGYFGFGSFSTYSTITYPPDDGGNMFASISGTTGSGVVIGYKNGTQVVNNTGQDNNLQDYYLSIFGDNRTLAPGFGIHFSSPSQATINFYAVGEYLTGSELSTLSNIINTFQTSLGRNIY